jgi:uncharacterized membrane protein
VIGNNRLFLGNTKTIVMEENQDLFTSQVDNDTAREMYDASRWARLFSILIFSACGIVLLIFLAAGSRLFDAYTGGLGTSGEAGSAFTYALIIIVLALLVVCTMMYFLLRSANSIRKGLQLKDQALFNRGLSDMKVYFTIYGVLSILGLLGNLISAF